MSDMTLPDPPSGAVPRAATIVSTAAAEWLKLRSLRSTWWFAGSALIIVVGAALGSNDQGAGDPLRTLAAPIGAIQYFVQYIAAAMGMLVMTGEFATRSITVSVACTPSRTRVVLAKALVVGAAVLTLGLVVAGIGTLGAAARLGAIGELGADHLAHILAMAAFLALLAVIALGIGTVLRRSAGAFTVVLAVLLLVPEVLRLLAERFDARFLNTIGDWTPAPIGWRFIDGGWRDGLALAAWALAAIALGIWALRSRDV